jgi:hypothetical protein
VSGLAQLDGVPTTVKVIDKYDIGIKIGAGADVMNEAF